MTDNDIWKHARGHKAAVRAFAAVGTLALAATLVLFAWNSFAVPVLDAEVLRFKEAIGLTLLVAIAGRLFSPRDHRDERIEPSH